MATQHSPAQMAALLSRMMLHFPQSGGARSSEELANLALDWCEDLASFTAQEIDRAVKLCRRDENRRFFPSTGEFIGYCHMAHDELCRHKARLALPEPEPTREDYAKNAENWKKLREKLGSMVA